VHFKHSVSLELSPELKLIADQITDAEVEDAFAKIRARAAIAALKRGSAHLYEHLPNTEIVWDMYHDSKSPYVCRACECHGQGFKLKSGLRMHLASKQHRVSADAY